MHFSQAPQVQKRSDLSEIEWLKKWELRTALDSEHSDKQKDVDITEYF